MLHQKLTRRSALLGIVATTVVALRPRPLAAGAPVIEVAKDPNCGCCAAWVEIMEKAGFAVRVELMEYDRLQNHKRASGVSAAMASCHTAHVEGYVIEGHVPAADILRLLNERPDAIGLAVPGMPFGSPGMGPESQRDAYAVHLIRRDGTTETFSVYPAA